LVEESLDVGRLLGMKIIGKEEAALESIKISPKKERKMHANQGTN